jgi:D-ribose pyranose/furanose isomerase RbsD
MPASFRIVLIGWFKTPAGLPVNLNAVGLPWLTVVFTIGVPSLLVTLTLTIPENSVDSTCLSVNIIVKRQPISKEISNNDLPETIEMESVSDTALKE